MSTPPPIIALMGATAVGKTACALELVRRAPFAIVSVDSAMIYRGLDIGTAKPDAATLAVAPHRMIDICDPADICTAYDFAQQAREAITEIQAAGQMPLLVGGSRLYFQALLEGLADVPETDPEVRTNLRARWAAEPPGALHAELAQCDPVLAARVTPADKQRILRGLEVFISCGIPLTTLQKKSVDDTPPLAHRAVILDVADRATLHDRIAQRFTTMLADGLIEETAALRARGDLTLEHPSMRCVGYRQVWEHLDGKTEAEEMRTAGIVATRQLAKRQLSWLRHHREAAHLVVDARPAAAQAEDVLGLCGL